MKGLRFHSSCQALLRPARGVHLFRIVSDSAPSDPPAVAILHRELKREPGVIPGPRCILCLDASAQSEEAQFLNWSWELLSAAPLGRASRHGLRAVFEAAQRSMNEAMVSQAALQLLQAEELARVSIVAFVFTAILDPRVQRFLDELPTHLRIAIVAPHDVSLGELRRAVPSADSLARLRRQGDGWTLEAERPGGPWFEPIEEVLSNQFHLDKHNIERWEELILSMHLRTLQSFAPDLKAIATAISHDRKRPASPIDGSRALMLLLIGAIDVERMRKILQPGNSEHLYELQHIDRVAPEKQGGGATSALRHLLKSCLGGEPPLVLAFRAMNDVFDFLNLGAGRALCLIFLGPDEPARDNFGVRTVKIKHLEMFLKLNLDASGHDIFDEPAVIRNRLAAVKGVTPKTWRLLGDLATRHPGDMARECYEEAVRAGGLEDGMPVNHRIERLKARIGLSADPPLDLDQERAKDPYLAHALLQDSNWELLRIRSLIRRRELKGLRDWISSQERPLSQSTLHVTTCALYRWYWTNYAGDSREKQLLETGDENLLALRMDEAVVTAAWAELVYELGIAAIGPFDPNLPRKPKIVVSYKTGDDSQRVQALCDRLNKHGCDAFNDQVLAAQAGVFWSEEILHRFLLADVSIAVVTEDYATSAWCRIEQELLRARASASGSPTSFQALWLKLGGEKGDLYLGRTVGIAIAHPPDWSNEKDLDRIVEQIFAALTRQRRPAIAQAGHGLAPAALAAVGTRDAGAAVRPGAARQSFAEGNTMQPTPGTFFVAWDDRNGEDIVWGEAFSARLEVAFKELAGPRLSLQDCEVQRISGFEQLPASEALGGTSVLFVVMPGHSPGFTDEAKARLDALLRHNSGARDSLWEGRVIPISPHADRLPPAAPLEQLKGMLLASLEPTEVAKAARAALINASLMLSSQTQGALFISYSHRDGLAMADLLDRELRARGLRVFLDRALDREEQVAIAPGSQPQQVIERAIRSHGFVLLLDTAAAEKSAWVREEMKIAIGHLLPLLPIVVPSGDESAPGLPLGGRFRAVRDLGREVRVRDEAELLEKIDEIEKQVVDMLLDHARSRRRLVHASQVRFESLKFQWSPLEAARLHYQVERAQPLPKNAGFIKRFVVGCSPYPRLIALVADPLRRYFEAGEEPGGARRLSYAAPILVHGGVETVDDLELLSERLDNLTVLRPHEITEDNLPR